MEKESIPQQDIAKISKKSNKTLITFLIFLLVLATGTTVFFAYKTAKFFACENRQLIKNVLQTKQQFEQKAPVPKASVTPNLTENWEVYFNKEKGFGFKYAPPHITYQDGIFYNEKGLEFASLSFLENETVDNYISQLTKPGEYKIKITSQDQITIGDEITATVISIGGIDVSRQILFEHDSTLYKFTLFLDRLGPEANTYSDLVDLILSTFQFIDKDQVGDLDSWDTYKNTEYNYSFKYPANFSLRTKAGSNIPLESADWIILEGPYENIQTLRGPKKYWITVKASELLPSIQSNEPVRVEIRRAGNWFVTFKLKSVETQFPTNTLFFDQIISTFKVNE